LVYFRIILAFSALALFHCFDIRDLDWRS